LTPNDPVVKTDRALPEAYERETKQENDSTVIEQLLKEGRDREREAPTSQSPSLKRRAAKRKKKK